MNILHGITYSFPQVIYELVIKDFYFISIPKEIKDITAEDLSSKPEVVFLCYTKPSENQSTTSLKNRFGNQLFSRKGSSDYALQKWVCNDDISSILAIESDLSNENNIISFNQPIDQEQYKFSLVFVDSNDVDCWLSLDRLP